MNEELKLLLGLTGTKTEAELLVFKEKTPLPKGFDGNPRLVKMTSEECQTLCQKCGKNGITYRKGYEDRVVESTISNEQTDRQGDVMRVDGIDVGNYVNNPVVHYAHETRKPPIGNCIKIWKDPTTKELKAWTLFMDNEVDHTGFSDLIFKMVSNGFIRGTSIGFLPVKGNRPDTEAGRQALGLGQWGMEYQQSSLTEYSHCNVPANASTLTAHIQQSNPEIRCMFTQKDLQTAQTFFEMSLFAEFEKAIKEFKFLDEKPAPVLPVYVKKEEPNITVINNIDLTPIKELILKLDGLTESLKALYSPPVKGGGQEKGKEVGDYTKRASLDLLKVPEFKLQP